MSTISGNAVASLNSRLDLHFSIPARIENKLSRIESRIESRSAENDRFIHHWFLNNFQRPKAVTQHGMVIFGQATVHVWLKQDQFES